MKRSRQPKNIAQLLKRSELQYDQPLFTKLDSVLQNFFKENAIIGCRLGNVQNGQLLIELPNANWTMRLQFLKSQLLSLCRSVSPGIKKINLKVNPQLATSRSLPLKNKKQKTINTAKMPLDVANSFLALAQDTTDPGLKKALQSLAKHSKKE